MRCWAEFAEDWDEGNGSDSGGSDSRLESSEFEEFSAVKKFVQKGTEKR